MDVKFKNKKPLIRKKLGTNVPKRGGIFSPIVAKQVLKLLGWQTVGEMPNVSQAVLLAAPHTSNFDGLYAIPILLALDLDIKIMGKHSLFKVPVLGQFLRWAGIIPVDRNKKGSVLQSNVRRFKTGEPFFLGIAPEGTRAYTDKWKTGFYQIAYQAGVPIIPVAMDYASKKVIILNPIYPSGNIAKDLPKIYAQYKGVVPKYSKRLSQPLKDINKTP